MAASNAHLLGLSDAERRQIEQWLVEFELSWHQGLLVERARALPADPRLRSPLLIEMVKIDIERQWQCNRRLRLEDYLQAHGELGEVDVLPPDLIQAEHEVRVQFGDSPDLADYARRFPRQIKALEHLLANATATGESSTPFLPGAPPTVDFHAPEHTDPGLPNTLGRYRIIRRLGQGGMGVVYLAEDETLGRTVALKVPHASVRIDDEGRARFYREARAAATLHHPHLCTVHDVGEIGGILYLTMAYVEGRTLAELLRSGGKPPPRQAAELVHKVALALAEAHAHGVIHRDLKPANLMINSRGEPVVMDFGLARLVMVGEERLTRTGSVLGTPAYMAPEQVRGDRANVGPPCDVYSLGAILYELLTGTPPFQGSPAEVFAQILTSEPPPPRQLGADVDSRLEAICLKALAKNPSDRYGDMTGFAQDLAGWLSGDRAGSVKQPARRLRTLAIAASVTVFR